MMEHTQLIDAIDIRTSIRAYDPDEIAEDQARQLRMTLDAINMLSGLDIQLVLDQPKVFADANASGHFTNAANYLALVGPKDNDEAREKAGFYAERVVLAATLYGLGTCWVGGSWNREEAARHCQTGRSKELYMGVVIGHPEHHLTYTSKKFEELAEIQRTHRESKSYEAFTRTMSAEAREAAPDWFKAGVEAARKAPSARNGQPILFSWDPQTGTAIAQIDPELNGPTAANDLGIAKLHFQIGAGSGEWGWGNGAMFIKQ
ncbi:nitroreductase family protein [Bifidobacterium vespertilionis]|uniref:nitroreductase family protein n=1 Tax=Bifidobacterium vespertilionis TaxID=2562524 RepID=UPI001BDC3937|nr:nitroreductase family protein [Bifidobacterium vespertilionis]